MSQKEDVMFGNSNAFATEMKRLLNSKEMSDIKFVIGPNRKAIYGHRCILAARCDVFRAMFSDKQTRDVSSSDVPFVLSDTTPDIFLPLLEFIYTNSVTLNHKIVVDVLGSSLEYGLDGLRELCVEYLIQNLAVNTACEAMQAAVTYGQDDLRVKAMKYIEHNTTKVFQSKGFQELSDTALVTILQSNDLTIDEMDILQAVREWANVNSVVLSKPVCSVAKEVVPHIRLPILSPDELSAVEEQNQRDNLLNVEQLSFAWKFHALKIKDTHNPLTSPRKGTKPRESHKGMGSL